MEHLNALRYIYKHFVFPPMYILQKALYDLKNFVKVAFVFFINKKQFIFVFLLKRVSLFIIYTKKNKL